MNWRANSSRSYKTTSSSRNITPRQITIQTTGNLRNRSNKKNSQFSNSTEQTTLWNEYVQLSQEIAELQCEIKPLRKKCEQIQETLSKKSRITNKEKFTSAQVNYQNESESLEHQIYYLEQIYSPNSIHMLTNEVREGERVAQLLMTSCQETQEEIDQIQSQIDSYKFSWKYQEIQEQKERISKLKAKLKLKIQKNNKLKYEAEIYSNEEEKKENPTNESIIIGKLSRKLNQLKIAHTEKCELLLTLRNKQIKEIETIKEALES